MLRPIAFRSDTNSDQKNNEVSEFIIYFFAISKKDRAFNVGIVLLSGLLRGYSCLLLYITPVGPKNIVTPYKNAANWLVKAFL